jgi:hypothetical protein
LSKILVTIKVNIYCDSVIKRNNTLFSNGIEYLYAVVHSSRKLFGSETGALYGGGRKVKIKKVRYQVEIALLYENQLRKELIQGNGYLPKIADVLVRSVTGHIRSNYGILSIPLEYFF